MSTASRTHMSYHTTCCVGSLYVISESCFSMLGRMTPLNTEGNIQQSLYRLTMLWVIFSYTISTWKNRPRFGLFIHAVKSGQKPSLTKPGFGWKEWADEAIKQRLMQYSRFHNGDVMVHFVGDGQGLWSQLRSLFWSEIELIASKGQTV